MKRNLASTPNHIIAHTMLATCLNAIGKVDEALHEATVGIRCAPELSCTYSIHAEILWKQRTLEKAEQSIRTAIGIDPDHAAYFEVLAKIRASAGDLSGALMAANHCITLEPECIEGLLTCSGVLQRLGRHQEALAVAKRALALAPEDARCHRITGCVLLAFNYPENVRLSSEYFRAALRLDPSIGKTLENTHILSVDQSRLIWLFEHGASKGPHQA